LVLYELFGNLALDMVKKQIKTSPHPALIAASSGAMTVAHRGASMHERENTIEAFKKAIELGAEMIEFDVRKSADGVLIVHHDATIRGRLLRQMSYEEILVKYPERKVATLEAVLACIDHRAMLNVEVKEPDLGEEVVKMLQRSYESHEYVITSYQDSVLETVRRIAPDVCTGLILGSPVRSKSLVGHLRDLDPWERLSRVGADFLSVHYVLADLSILRGARKRGIPLMIWTVNSQRRRRKLLSDSSVAGVIVDDPTRE
jgi:glycerophosphoryl diester phosphodiesterase